MLPPNCGHLGETRGGGGIAMSFRGEVTRRTIFSSKEEGHLPHSRADESITATIVHSGLVHSHSLDKGPKNGALGSGLMN